MATMDNMGLGEMAQYFKTVHPWCNDPPDVRKNMIMAIRAENDGLTEKANAYLDKAIAASE